MSMAFLDRGHRWLRANPLAYRLVIGTRLLLCAGFLPTGLVKMLGQPFTVMDPATPVGLFFHALHQSGFYWRFIGTTQVLAAVLVLIPVTAHLGAMLFFPVILNIFVITVSMGFRGTPVVTGLMLLASLLLLAWDYHRWRGLLTNRSAEMSVPEPLPLSAIERYAYSAGGFFGILFFLNTRSLVPKELMAPSLIGALAAMLVVFVQALRKPWRMQRTIGAAE
jgi:hypothetical protein